MQSLNTAKFHVKHKFNKLFLSVCVCEYIHENGIHPSHDTLSYLSCMRNDSYLF